MSARKAGRQRFGGRAKIVFKGPVLLAATASVGERQNGEAVCKDTAVYKG